MIGALPLVAYSQFILEGAKMGWKEDFDKGAKASEKDMKKGYKKQRDSYPQAGDSSPAPRVTIYPGKKKRKM